MPTIVLDLEFHSLQVQNYREIQRERYSEREKATSRGGADCSTRERVRILIEGNSLRKLKLISAKLWLEALQSKSN
jgi:hypothetical protein